MRSSPEETPRDSPGDRTRGPGRPHSWPRVGICRPCHHGSVAPESQAARSKRHRQRALFDPAADLYDASRPAYPDDVVDHLARTTLLDASTCVLEVGCGTGQLTVQLAARTTRLTAIDIGPSMVAGARRRSSGASITFRLTSFEDLVAENGSFDLIAFADSFHWIDPEVRCSKSARLLRPGGWIAILSLEQRYDEPLGSLLRQMWVSRSHDGGAWLARPAPTFSQCVAESGLFNDPIETSCSSRTTMRSSSVLDLERTRATALDWHAAERKGFTDELRSHLSEELVELEQLATVTMAQVRPLRGAPTPR